MQSLWLPTDRQGRVTTLQRWFRWLDERGGIAGHPMVAVWAAMLAADTGRPAEAERWADIVDRWQYEDSAQPPDPSAEAWAAVIRTQLSEDHAPSVPGASSLTSAELRVLPMLATHLSFPEIGTDLFLSPHTVKSQAMSIYRKLGASSRSQAVAFPQPSGRPVPGAGSPGGVTAGLSCHPWDAAPSGARCNGGRSGRAEAYERDDEIPGDPAQAGDGR